MSTADQMKSAALHGEALVVARELAQAAQDDVFRLLLARMVDPDVTPEQRARIGGELAGQAFAQLGPGADHEEIGRQLLVAGLLLSADVIDHDVLAQTVRETFEAASGPESPRLT